MQPHAESWLGLNGHVSFHFARMKKTECRLEDLDVEPAGGQKIYAQTIGAGGMEDIYRARDEVLDRDVAMKVLPPRMNCS